MVATKINGRAKPKGNNPHEKNVSAFDRGQDQKGYALKPFQLGNDLEPSRMDRVQHAITGKTMQSVLQSVGFATLTPVPGGRTEIELPYVDSWVIHACIRAFADAVRGLPVAIFQSGAKDAKPISDGDDVAKLFAAPVPGPNGGVTWSELVVSDVVHRKLSGETFWFLADMDGNPIAPAGATEIPLPTQIFSINGADVYDVRDPRTGLITSYWYVGTNNQNSPQFPPESIVHFADYNPYDPQRGLGSAEVALRPASVGFQAERYQEAVLRAGGPGAYLIYKKEQFSRPEERRMQQTIDEGIRQPDRIGGLQLLSGEVEIVPNPAKPNEMFTKDSQAWQRDVICSIFGVPPPVIGIYDRAIMHNITEAYRQFWINIKSYLDSVSEVLNAKFFPRLKEARARVYRIAFDYSGVGPLQQDESAKIKMAADIAAQAVGWSVNDVCRMLKVTADLPPGGEVAKPITEVSGTGSAKGDTGVGSDSAAATPSKTLPARVAPRFSAIERRSYVSSYHARVTSRHERRMGVETDRWLAKYEREQILKIRRFAETGEPQRTRAAAKEHTSLEEQIDAFLLLQKARWAKLLEEATADVIESAYLTAGADMANQLAVVSIPMTDVRVLSFLAQQEIKLTEGVTSTLANRVRMVLLERLAEPANIAGLQQALLKVLPELTEDLRRVFGTREARAATIARTEVNKATSNARILQMLEAGVRKIQWGSSEDDHVRATHQTYDGQERVIGEEFAPNLRWPDDERGPPEEVINCRCVPLPIVED